MAGPTGILGGDADKGARDRAIPKSGAVDDHATVDTLDEDAVGDQDEDGEGPALGDRPAGMDLDFGNLLGSAARGSGHSGHAAM